MQQHQMETCTSTKYRKVKIWRGVLEYRVLRKSPPLVLAQQPLVLVVFPIRYHALVRAVLEPRGCGCQLCQSWLSSARSRRVLRRQLRGRPSRRVRESAGAHNHGARGLPNDRQHVQHNHSPHFYRRQQRGPTGMPGAQSSRGRLCLLLPGWAAHACSDPHTNPRADATADDHSRARDNTGSDDDCSADDDRGADDDEGAHHH